MNNPTISFIISSYKRLLYIRRTLGSINKTVPPIPFEVIVSEEINEETPLILEELKKYEFPYTVILSDVREFEIKTGIKKYFNDPSLTYNTGLLRCSGQIVGVLGNDIIITEGCIQELLNEAKQLNCEDWIVYSTTYNCPKSVLSEIGEYGENLKPSHIRLSSNNVLQSHIVMSIVNNYLSISPLSTLLKINGWDEKYLLGIASQDSDVSRRIMAIPGNKYKYSEKAITLHQSHESWQFDPDKRELWDTGVAINHKHYASWDGSYRNKQSWPIGTFGIKEIIKKNYPNQLNSHSILPPLAENLALTNQLTVI